MILPYAPGREGLRRVAEMLRPLPAWYKWDFAVLACDNRPVGTCGCAIGLARAVWTQFRAIGDNAAGTTPMQARSRAEARSFNMKIKDYKAIFGMQPGDFWAYGEYQSASEITPADVAKAIDDYLAA